MRRLWAWIRNRGVTIDVHCSHQRPATITFRPGDVLKIFQCDKCNTKMVVRDK